MAKDTAIDLDGVPNRPGVLCHMPEGSTPTDRDKGRTTYTRYAMAGVVSPAFSKPLSFYWKGL